MFSVASIYHRNHDLDSGGVLRLMLELGFESRAHEWHGLSLCVKQVRHSDGCDICLQVEEERDEILEEAIELSGIAEERGLDEALIEYLRDCDQRIDVLPFQVDATEEQYRNWMASGVQAEIAPDATLENPKIRRVVTTLAAELSGIAYDNVEDIFLTTVCK